jgi:mannose-1-phosphate guanylyltransferase
LSTNEHPKYLLSLEDGGKSLLRKTYERVKKITDKIFVITSSPHEDLVRKELEFIDSKYIIVEPDMRGTSNCILMSADYISRIETNNDTPIIFLHSDQIIKNTDEFEKSINKAIKLFGKKKQIVLVGTKPTHPSIKFGYIKYQNNKVMKFMEKPDYKTAVKYVDEGDYLWNTGIFICSNNVFLETAKNYSRTIERNYKRLSAIGSGESLENYTKSNEYKKTYLSFKNEAIEYSLIERAKNLLTIEASYEWTDVGTLEDFMKEYNR